MKVSSLISKLHKMNIGHSIIDNNGYNMDVMFIINGMIFKAGYNKGFEDVLDFCREVCYNKSEQEMQRRFFDNFKQLLKYAQK